MVWEAFLEAVTSKRFQGWVSKGKEEGTMSLIGGERCGAFRKSEKMRGFQDKGKEL